VLSKIPSDDELYSYALSRFDDVTQGKISAAEYRYALLIYTFAIYYQEPIDAVVEDLNTKKQCEEAALKIVNARFEEVLSLRPIKQNIEAVPSFRTPFPHYPRDVRVWSIDEYEWCIQNCCIGPRLSLYGPDNYTDKAIDPM
jgi:hypothetical protein